MSMADMGRHLAILVCMVYPLIALFVFFVRLLKGAVFNESSD